MGSRTVRVGLLGCGHVGSALVRQIADGAADIEARTGVRLEVTRVAVRNLARERDVPRPRRVAVAGKHCEQGDVVIADARLPEDVAVGDVLVTPVTGAYGASMASNYNKVPRPAVVFVRNGASRVVVRRETYEDLVRLDAPADG